MTRLPQGKTRLDLVREQAQQQPELSSVKRGRMVVSLARLAEDPRNERKTFRNLGGLVDSIKAAHGDPMRVSFLKYLCGDKLSASYGHDYAAFESFVTGGDGWLSAFPNIVPTLAVDLFDAVREKKDLVLARQIWDRIAPIAYYFMYERKGDPQSPHWLAVIKETMAMLGCEAGVPRLPTRPMSDEQRAVLRHYPSMVYPDQVSPVA